MASPMLTWQNLLTFKFPTPPPTLEARGATDTTYTARNPPTRHIQPRLSIPDQSLPIGQQIPPCALAALSHGLASLLELPPITNVEDLTQNTSTELSEEHPASKNAVLSHASPVLRIAQQLIKAIFVAVDGKQSFRNFR